MKTINIYISLKKTVADPQGLTVKHALDSLGYKNVEGVRMGKYVQLKAEKITEEEIHDMCKKLLVNPIIEEYRFEITEGEK
jgi:phosphoribosylformylglycinamidine synthase